MSTPAFFLPPGLSTSHVHETVEWMNQVWGPGLEQMSEPGDLAASVDGTRLAFTALVRPGLNGPTRERIGVLDRHERRVDVLGETPGNERFARWSPDGRLAFLSDPDLSGRFRLCVCRGPGSEQWFGPDVPGTIERIRWDTTGGRIAAVSAPLSADRSGVRGSGRLSSCIGDEPSWVPTVTTEDDPSMVRRLFVIDLLAGRAEVVSGPVNVWEAEWLDEDRIAVVASDRPGESAWYGADVRIVEIGRGTVRPLYRPSRQVQLAPSPPGGRVVALLEALASDRELVAGSLVLVDAASGKPRTVDTKAIDVTSAMWRPDGSAVLAGHRHLETVVADMSPAGVVSEVWATEGTLGHPYPAALPLPDGTVAAVHESWEQTPEIVAVGPGGLEVVASFGTQGTDFLAHVGGHPHPVSWESVDGLRIEGWLITDHEACQPAPLLLEVHGGPVWLARNRWSARNIVLPLLVSRGFSILQPNFRGSVGRGAEFMEAILGDMGGLDIDDCLAGVDASVAANRADPSRLGILGGSYGGFLTSLIVTRDHRFGAAVALSPVTDWWSQHGTSNIGEFDRRFLDSDPASIGGRYVDRSPARYAEQVETPLLIVAGATDRCTPIGQAQQMHSALVEAGRVGTELVIYPEEGHGVREYPAVIDYCARVVAWFERYLGVR